MSKVQDSLPASDAETSSVEPVLDLPSSRETSARSEGFGELGMDDSAGSGGRTLLSLPSPQQGRRSLFRR
jgi:hypothetical protein